MLDPALNVFAAGSRRMKPKKDQRSLILLAVLVLVCVVIAIFWWGGEQSANTFKEENFFVPGDGDQQTMPLSERAPKTVNNVGTKAVDSKDSADELEKPVIEIPESRKDTVTQEKAAQDEGIYIKKTRMSSSVSLSLSNAYEALQSGRLSEARQHYENVLQRQAKQTDALLGLANIDAQEGQVIDARRRYEDVLAIEPANKVAQLGWLYTYQSDVSSKGLTVLQEMLSTYPKNPDILLAIGHQYAKQSKWSEAQKAYFNAFTAQPDNPVIAYNLAVSLDKLEKYKAAVSYYEKAISLKTRTYAGLDEQKIYARIKELEVASHDR